MTYSQNKLFLIFVHVGSGFKSYLLSYAWPPVDVSDRSKRELKGSISIKHVVVD